MGRLTDRTVKSLPEGRHGDGGGLYLVVSASGRRSWMLRFQLEGKRRDMGLGSYPEIGLADARIGAADARKIIAQGSDPVETRKAAKKAEKPIPTFEELAEHVIKEAQSKSVNSKVRYQWERHLGPAYCGPILAKPVTEITTIDITNLLRPVWREKPEVARKLYPAIRRVFEFARIRLRDEHGITLQDNPARWDDLKAMGFEAPAKLTRGSHPSLHHSELPAFMADVRGREAMAARGLEFLILTNVRTGAVLQARWSEVDLDKAIWTVPLESLKDRKHRRDGFRVPLCPRAVELLKAIAETRTCEFIFPSRIGPPNAGGEGQPMSNMALLTLLKRMQNTTKWLDPMSKRPITAHGFRATFRTWAEEATGFSHSVIEEAMGHQVGTEVERAYRRTDVLERRRELMNAWGLFCEPEVPGTNVVPIRQAG